MISFAASDLKNKTAHIFMEAARAPVRITKRGTEGFVVVSWSQFMAFKAMEEYHNKNTDDKLAALVNEEI